MTTPLTAAATSAGTVDLAGTATTATSSGSVTLGGTATGSETASGSLALGGTATGSTSSTGSISLGGSSSTVVPTSALASTSFLGAAGNTDPLVVDLAYVALASTSALAVQNLVLAGAALSSTSALATTTPVSTIVSAPGVLLSTSSLGVQNLVLATVTQMLSASNLGVQYQVTLTGVVALASTSTLTSYTPEVLTDTVTLLSTSTMALGPVFIIDRSGNVLTLTLQSSVIDTQPGALTAGVGNGQPGDTVSFTIDGVATGVTVQLDSTGSATFISIPVNGYTVGSHNLAVVSGTGVSSAVTAFSVNSAPIPFSPLPVGVLPPAVVATPIQMWTFQAYNFSDVTAVQTYTFGLNPDTLSQNFGDIKITSLPTTIPSGNLMSWEGDPVPATWTWSGRVLTQTDHDALRYWAARNDRVWVTDEFLRRYLMKIDSLKMTRKRDRDRPWHHIYTMTASVLSGQGVLV